MKNILKVYFKKLATVLAVAAVLTVVVMGFLAELGWRW